MIRNLIKSINVVCEPLSGVHMNSVKLVNAVAVIG
jgi:hypothetical protein